MDKKFENICFCCLTEEGLLKNMLDEVFVAAQLKIQFVECYTVCSGIVPDHTSTKNICSACETKLKSSYEFRELCRESYQTLKDKTEFSPNLYVDVKHEVASDNENDFLYDSSSKKEGQKSKARQFSQVYVRDLNEEPPLETIEAVTKPPSPALEKPAADEVFLKAEETQNLKNVDDNKEEPSKKPKHTRAEKRRRVNEKSLKKIKVRKEDSIPEQPPPELDVADMESTFMCYHCETLARTYNEFLKHRDTDHKVGNKFQSHNRVCGLCNIEVKNFVEHIGDSHKDYRPCICSYCDKGRFQTPLELRGHLYSHLTCKATHECLSCNEKFKNEVHLRTHIGSHHKNTNDTYLCPYCGMEFKMFLPCQDHFQRVHEQTKKLFPCFHCKKVYMVGKYYEDHDCSKRKSDLKPNPSATVECDRCSFIFSCPDELACHRTRGCEADPEANKCRECGKSFGSRKKLVRHIRTHDPAKRLFICDICGHGSMSAGQLKLHKFMHVTDRPFKCNVCPATFKLEQHLKGHQKVHEDKPFECYVCEKRFRTYPNIRQHMAVHSDSSVLRRFACEICGKTSTSNTTLKNHLKTHTNEQNVWCNLCPKTFGDNTQLKNHHRKVHEGMFYECKFCGKPYKEKVKFRNHLYVHRGFKPFNCPACPSQHVEKYIFVKHLRGQHNIVFDERKHGYRETENIKKLIEECLRRPSDSKTVTASMSGVRIVATTVNRTQPQQQRQVEQAVIEPNAECSYSTQMSDDSGPVNMLMQKQYFMPYDRTELLPPAGYHLHGN